MYHDYFLSSIEAVIDDKNNIFHKTGECTPDGFELIVNIYVCWILVYILIAC